jgi:hypothetical protein
MRLSKALVPIVTFLLAVVLSVFTAPLSRLTLRAAGGPTIPFENPCGSFVITKHTGKADRWHLKVEQLFSTVENLNSEARAEEMTVANISATVTGQDPQGHALPPTTKTYRVLVGSHDKKWQIGIREWTLSPQSTQLPDIQKQIRLEWLQTVAAVDLFGNPVPGSPPEGSTVKSVQVIAPQTILFETAGFLTCRHFGFGTFVGRPLTYTVDGNGTGGGTN